MRKLRERKINRWNGPETSKKRTGVWRYLLFIIAVATVAGIAIFSINLINNILNAKVNCSVCDSKNKVVIPRDDITASLIVIASPANNKLAGAWLIVEKEKAPSVVIFYIPPGVSIGDYTGDFSSFIQVSDLEYAGNLINSNRAKEYSIWQLENMSGFTVQNYMWLDSGSLDEYAGLFGDITESTGVDYTQKYAKTSEVSQSSTLINSLFDRFSLTSVLARSSGWDAFLGNLDSNVGATQLPLYFMHMKNVLNAGNHTMIDLSQLWALNELTNESERKLLTINYSEFDKRIEEAFSSLRPRTIEKEQARVEVYNGSEVAGLASRYARKIQNFGINVVRYDNAPNSVERTVIYINNKERFENSFEGVKRVVCEKCEIVEGRPEFITTGDIVVILGKEKLDEIQWR